MSKRVSKVSSPKISIVIPSFNKVGYIGKTLDSIVSQKYPNYEVIIQDGGSVDGSLDIIKKYAKNHPQIKWSSKEDQGQADAINRGLSLATGKIITYINADDIYLKDAFSIVEKCYMNNPKALWFAGRGIVMNDKGGENNSSFYKYWVKPYKNFLLELNVRAFLLCVNYIMQPSVFLSRNAVDKFGLFAGTTKFVLEYEKWLDLSGLEMPVIIDKEISAFRMAAGNITSTRTHELLAEDLSLVKKYTNNPLILGIHWLNNIGRLISSRLTKML